MTLSDPRGRPVPRRAAPRHAVAVVAAALAVVAGSGAAAAEADATPLPATTDHVVVVGVPGLRWGQVTEAVTPTMWRLSEEGSVGNLTVRAGRSLTCPQDGWLTLGAGNRAAGVGKAGSACQPYFPYIPPVRTPGGGAVLPEMGLVVADNVGKKYGARPGALAEAVSCTTAVGPGATLAAADGAGVVDLYAARLPPSPFAERLLARCPVSVVGAEDLVPSPPRVNDALAAADRLVAAVDAARPADSVLIVVGVSEIGAQSQFLHPAIVAGPTYQGGGWLRSASTSRVPYLQLIDVAPTALHLLGVEKPPEMAGQPAIRGPDRTADLRDDVAGMVDEGDMAASAYRLAGSWFGGVTAMVVLFCALAWAVLRVARRLADAGRPVPARRWRRFLEGVALSVAAVGVSSFLVQLLPWWRQLIPVGFYATWICIWAGLITAVSLLLPWRRGGGAYRWVGPAMVGMLLSAVVLGADVLRDSRLEFGSVNGYNAIVAGRFVGFGNTGWAVFATGLLFGLGLLATPMRRWVAAVVVGVGGFAGVALTANPNWGNDFGGTISMTAAVLILILLVADIRVNVRRLFLVMVVAGVSAMAIAYLDYLRPPEERTHLGRFVEDLLSGDAWTVISRKLVNNYNLLVSSPLTFTVPAALVLGWFVLRHRWSGVPQAWAESSRLRAGFWAALVCAGIGTLVNDSGIAVMALAISVGVPWLVAIGARRIAPAPGTTESPDEPAAAPRTVPVPEGVR